ncbi:MAG: hypothetical protein LUH08_07735 [Ruminococcus sp.]|nr:hypothetical protein [Ruminococcus sp.]
MKLKRLNRGLLLGAVLLVGTVSFVVAQSVRFSKYKPDVETKVDEYISDMCQANIDSTSEDSTEPLVELINNYWQSGGSENAFDYWCYTMGTTLEMINDDYDDVYGEIESMDYYLSNVSISQYGQGCAKVTFDCSINVVYNGNPMLYDLDYHSCFDFSYQEDLPSEDEKYEATIEYWDCGLILQLDGDEWKIINSCSGGWSCGEPETIEVDSSEEVTADE